MSLGSSSKPDDSVQVDLVVANCDTYNTWIQFISPRPVLSPPVQCCSASFMEGCRWLNYFYACPCWIYVNSSENPWKRLGLFAGFPLLFASWNFSFASSLDMVCSLLISCYLYVSTQLNYVVLVKHPKWFSFPSITYCFLFRPGLYPKPMPVWLVIFWTSVGVGLVIFLIMWSWKSLGRKRRWFR